MNAPFLPEPEVTPQTAAPAKKNTVKTLLLWVLLIAMFLGIWQFLSPAEKKAPHVEKLAELAPCPQVAETSSFWSSTAITLLPMAFLVFLFFLYLRAFRQNDAFNIVQEPGRLAMANRRFADAVELFRATVPKFAKQPAYRAVAVMNVADAQMKAGMLDAALASCAEIERSRTLLLGSGIRTHLASLTALLYALKGDVALAERWANEGRTRIAKNKDDRLGHAGYLRLAEAVVACRKGAPDAAVKMLDERWLELRYALNADTMRLVEVVRAFAEAQGGVRTSNAVAERLVRIEPVVKGELAFLGVAWPEMKAFLGATADSGAAA